MRKFIWASVLVLAGGLLAAPAAPAYAAPGDNAVVDDALSSARTQWFRDTRFGMFIHFGLYAQFKGQYGTCRDAEWIKRNCDIPWPVYEAAASDFNPASFNANTIVQAAKQAGQKYIVITSKHHDGFAMWPTAVNNWNITSRTPFQRDLLGELATAAKANGIKFGLYYSIWDWHDPDAQAAATYPAYLTRMRAQLQELVTRYDPALFWFDGEWDGNFTQQAGADLEKYMRTISPNAVINNRVIKRTMVDGDYGTPEQELAGSPPTAQLQESCMTINGTWGYAAWDTSFKSPATLARNLAYLTSNSANYLLNIGPTETGAITAGQASSLQGVGNWMSVNGAAIHGAGYTGLVAQPSWGRITRKANKLYLIVYNWSSSLHIGQLAPFNVTAARILGNTAPVTVVPSGDGFDLQTSGVAGHPIATVIEADIAVAAPWAPGGGTGLKAEFWNNTTFAGAPAVTRTDPAVNYAWRYTGSPAPAINTDNFASRWTGSIEPRYSEKYTFRTVSDDTVQLWIDGQLVISNTAPHGPTLNEGSITLVAGRRYNIRLEHTENGGEAYLKLIWSSPNTAAEIVPASQLRPTPGVTRIVNNTSAVYGAGWNLSTNRGLGDYNNDVHYATANGASLTYAFTGTGIDYLSERYSDQGLVDIYLDDVFQQTVNTTNGARLTQQVIYSARGLTAGSHTLRAVKRSGTYMLADRFDVTS